MKRRHERMRHRWHLLRKPRRGVPAGNVVCLRTRCGAVRHPERSAFGYGHTCLEWEPRGLMQQRGWKSLFGRKKQ